jgi:small-conductance mechanosensitive channel
MPVSPPLDRVPAIPPKVVNKIVEEMNKAINRLSQQVLTTSKKADLLPDTISCDDPLVKDALDSLKDAQDALRRVKDLLRVVNTTAQSLRAVITAAQAIKAAQLLNPVTGPAVLAAELVVVQNLTIANAIVSIQQLTNLPNFINAALSPVQKALADATGKVCVFCPNETFEVDEETAEQLDVTQDDLEQEDSLEDLQASLDSLLRQQSDLLVSIQEAPSKVIQGTTVPLERIGKVGDYFVNTTTNDIYGPKTAAGWGEPVKY